MGKPKANRSSRGKVNGDDRRGSGLQGRDEPSRDSSESQGAAEASTGSTFGTNLRAREILRQLGQTFAQERPKGKLKAYRDLQYTLSNNMHILVPDVLSLKEMITLMATIEDYLKSDGKDDSGKSAIELISAFLDTGEPESKGVIN